MAGNWNYEGGQQLSGQIHEYGSAQMRSEDYRSKAAACLLAAESLKEPNVRARCLAMAQAWNRLADKAERRSIREVLTRNPEAA